MSDAVSATSLIGKNKNATATTAALGDELHAPSVGDGRVIGGTAHRERRCSDGGRVKDGGSGKQSRGRGRQGKDGRGEERAEELKQQDRPKRKLVKRASSEADELVPNVQRAK